MFRRKKRPLYSQELSPDEIFLDSHNFPGFDRERMEGRLEMLLSRRVAFATFFFFLGTATLMIFQMWGLQIVRGEELHARAVQNRMEVHTLLPERGVILDSRGKELAWNEAKFYVVLNSASLGRISEHKNSLENFFNSSIDIEKIRTYIGKELTDIIIADNLEWEEAERAIQRFPDIPFRIEASPVRHYVDEKGFSHLLGYVGYSDDAKETIFSPELKIGKAGIEKYFNEILTGKKGTRLAEVDAHGKIISQNLQENPQAGATIMLTVDAELQSQLYNSIAEVVQERGFQGGAGVFLDIKNGEVLALTSYPEFDANAISRGLAFEDFQALLRDPRAPFFPRALEGVYPPGSIFKPIVALAGLQEGVITPEKEIFSPGRIIVPNPFNPSNPTVFLDWKAHGWVNMKQALAVSSNVYFYSLGGGYGDQKGLGAARLKVYAELFGFGTPVFTGIKEAHGAVPDISKDNSWRIGDTYNFSIGQGGLQVTPVQIARYVATLASDGIFPNMHLRRGENEHISIASANIVSKERIPISQEYFSIVKEGMRKAVEEGTARAASGLGMKVAGKTGTAEIGNGRVHSWFIGFFPYENPKVAFAVVLENGSEKNLIGAPFATRRVLEWISQERPEYAR